MMKCKVSEAVELAVCVNSVEVPKEYTEVSLSQIESLVKLQTGFVLWYNWLKESSAIQVPINEYLNFEGN